MISLIRADSKIVEVAVCLVAVTALLFCFAIWFNSTVEKTLGTNLSAVKAAKAECEENIPRSQECSFVYTFIPPEEKLVENE